LKCDFFAGSNSAVSNMVWRQAIEFEANQPPLEPDNASGTHHPGNYI
jgi:hypothetical protein